MKRRNLVISLGVLATVGCTDGSQDDPSGDTDQPVETTEPASGARSVSDSGAFDSLKAKAGQLDVTIIYTVIGKDRGAYFEYEDDGKTRSEREDDVREFTKSYLSLVEEGWNSEWLSAALMRENETIIFSWEVEPNEVDAYLNGEMSKGGVSEDAVESIL